MNGIMQYFEKVAPGMRSSRSHRRQDKPYFLAFYTVDIQHLDSVIQQDHTNFGPERYCTHIKYTDSLPLQCITSCRILGTALDRGTQTHAASDRNKTMNNS